MSIFKYTKISREFISDLTDRVMRQESAVLLGHRYGGKRYVMARLAQRLAEKSVGPIVNVKLLGGSTVINEAGVLASVRCAVQEAQPGFDDGQTDTDDMLSYVAALADHTRKTPILMAANVDGLPDHLARRFLQSVRVLVQSGKAVAVLSGEYHFHGLVHGPNSEWDVENQYVLQGYDLPEFTRYVEQCARSLSVTLDNLPKVAEQLWTLTGGSNYLLKLALWTLSESYYGDAQVAPTGATPNFLDLLKRPAAYGPHVLRQANELIGRMPGCWPELERLIRYASVNIDIGDIASNTPSPLELAGVAVRNGPKLEFASVWMREFITSYYNNRRFGDLYAGSGRWDKAFEYYSKLTADEMKRPLNVEDRSDLAHVVNSLNASLHLAATKGPAEVRTLFTKACRSLFGFSDVSFWTKRGDEPWTPTRGSITKGDPDTIASIAAMLDSSTGSPSGLLEIPSPWSRFLAGAVVPAPARRPELKVRLLVGELDCRTILTGDREHLIKHVICHFVDAYRHALKVETDLQRLDVRNKHIELINSIFHNLGVTVRDVKETLRLAATHLQALGYEKRVSFCLVDPRGEHIEGVYCVPDDVDFAGRTNWELSEPTKDLQPYVIATRKPKLIDDATKEPLANQTLIVDGNVKAVAIVPLLDPYEEAIGTVHVERGDGRMPSQDEVDDLLWFGRLLAVAIQQSERVNLLQSALDKMNEPVAIIDRMERLRYANQSTADLNELPTGWHHVNERISFFSDIYGNASIKADVQDCIETESHRHVRHFEGIGNFPNYRGELLTSTITDWRQKTVGALIHINDLNYLHKIFDALKMVAGADSIGTAIDAVLRSAKTLGHTWGRCYKIHPKDRTKMISYASFGGDQEKLASFNQGGVELAHDFMESWLSLESRKPFAFCHFPDMDDKAEIITPTGLKVINVNYQHPGDILAKKIGEYWIDLPLFTKTRPLGKLTLQCSATLRPEEFEFLVVLSEVLSSLLDATDLRDEASVQKEKWIREAADLSIRYTAHNIRGRLGSLAPLLAGYEELVERTPAGSNRDALSRFNAKFRSTYHDVEKTMSHVVTTMMEAAAKPKWCNVEQLVIDSVDHCGLPKHIWDVKANPSDMMAHLDPILFESALIELIGNSMDELDNMQDARIEISISAISEGVDSRLRVIYRDNGRGIPADKKEAVFERGVTFKRPGKHGSGLGLSLVKKIATAHNGTVIEQGKHRGAIASNESSGVEFVFDFPIPAERKEE